MTSFSLDDGVTLGVQFGLSSALATTLAELERWGLNVCGGVADDIGHAGDGAEDIEDETDSAALGVGTPETDVNTGIEIATGGIRVCLATSTAGHGEELGSPCEADVLAVTVTFKLGFQVGLLLDSWSRSGLQSVVQSGPVVNPGSSADVSGHFRDVDGLAR